MTIRPVFFATLIAFSANIRAEESSPIYIAATETEALLAKEGQKVIVYGTTEGSSQAASGASFVNFKGSSFYLITFKSDLDQFPEGEPFELYDGKRVSVEGLVSVYQEKPQIKLTRPDQVAILSEEEVFPPVVEKTTEVTVDEPSMKSGEKPAEVPVEKEPKKRPPVDASEFFD